MVDKLRAAFQGLVENEGQEAYTYLDIGIGTASDSGKRWLAARDALKEPVHPTHEQYCDTAKALMDPIAYGLFLETLGKF